MTRVAGDPSVAATRGRLCGRTLSRPVLSCTLVFASDLEASAERVWKQVGTMAGVNAELAPWLTMTAPPASPLARIEDAPVGRFLFASWLLFRGVVPIDRHFFQLTSVDPGLGFVEESTSWSQARWKHERSIASRGDEACTLTDRLTFTPRLGLAMPLVKRVVGAIFRHRHDVLRMTFGGRAAAT